MFKMSTAKKPEQAAHLYVTVLLRTVLKSAY